MIYFVEHSQSVTAYAGTLARVHVCMWWKSIKKTLQDGKFDKHKNFHCIGVCTFAHENTCEIQCKNQN